MVSLHSKRNPKTPSFKRSLLQPNRKYYNSRVLAVFFHTDYETPPQERVLEKGKACHILAENLNKYGAQAMKNTVVLPQW